MCDNSLYDLTSQISSQRYGKKIEHTEDDKPFQITGFGASKTARDFEQSTQSEGQNSVL